MVTRSLSFVLTFLAVFTNTFTSAFAASAAQPLPASSAKYAHSRVPLYFEENRGQLDGNVRFVARAAGYTAFLTSGETVLLYRDGAPGQKGTREAVVRMNLSGSRQAANIRGGNPLAGKVNYLIGNDPRDWHTRIPTYGHVQYDGVYPGVDLVYRANGKQLEFDFHIEPGANPDPIRMKYDGVTGMHLSANGDLILETKAGNATILKPVAYQDSGDQRVPVTATYALLANNEVGFTLGNYDRSKPLVIDPAVGPSLYYSTYLGTNSGDYLNGLAVDAAGQAYVVGSTYSDAFPIAGASGYEPYSGSFPSTYLDNWLTAGVVTVLNAEGTELVYSTYIAGNGAGAVTGVTLNAVAVNASGNAFVVGQTDDPTFPMHKAFQSAYPPSRTAYTNATGLVFELSPQGDSLVFSSFIGGGDSDVVNGIALDSSGSAYIVGSNTVQGGSLTQSAFPYSGTAIWQRYTQVNLGAGFTNAFAAKINPPTSGNATLAYSTIIGSALAGGSSVYGKAIAVDSSGNAYVAGTANCNIADHGGTITTQTNMTNVNRAASYYVSNTWVLKLNTTASAAHYLDYLGGNAPSAMFSPNTQVAGLKVDDTGRAYVVGTTQASNFQTTAGAYQTTRRMAGIVDGNGTYQADAFVTIIAAGGGSFEYSTYLNGTTVSPTALEEFGDGSPYVGGIALGPNGEFTIAGATSVTNFPVQAAAACRPLATAFPGCPGSCGKATHFITKFDSSKNIVYSTFLGAGNGAGVSGLASNGTAIYALLSEYGNGLASGGAFDIDNSAGGKKLVVRIEDGPSIPTSITADAKAADVSTSPQTISLTSSVSAASTVNGGAVAYWVTDPSSVQVGSIVHSGIVANNVPPSASFTLPGNLPAGAYTIHADYICADNFLSSSTTAALAVGPSKTGTTLSLSGSVNPSVAGQLVTFTATVTPSGEGTPTGTVTFLDGGSSIGTGTLTGGIAAFTTSALSIGSHTISASYAGDDNFSESTGSLTGNPQVVTKIATATAVTPSTDPSVFGQPILFTATVIPVPPGTGTPTGTVTFLDGGVPIGTEVLSGGVATLTTSSLLVGSHTITAAYSGNGVAGTSDGSVTVSVVPASQSISAITFSPTTLIVGEQAAASATATSGLGVVFSSLTPATCHVSGSTVTGLASGTCTVAGNQPGNSNWLPADEVTASLLIPQVLPSISDTVVPGLVSWWPANGNPNDAYGSYHATPIGNLSYAPGRSGQAFSLDGETFTSAEGLPSPAHFSFSVWFNWDHYGTGNAEFLIGKGFTNYELHTGGDSGLNGLRFIPAGYPASWVDAHNVIRPGWNHAVATWDGSNAILYVNGELAASRAGVTGATDITQDSDPMQFGLRGDEGGLPYYGLIDEVAFFGRAISADEAAALFRAGSASLSFASSSVGPRSAAMGAVVNGNGLDAQVGVQYGTTTGYGSSASALPATIVANNGPTQVSITLSNLLPGTTYYYRWYAQSEAGTAYGAPQSFTTQSLLPQSISAITFEPETLALTASTTASATATSGLTVEFSTDTPLICSVSGTTVTALHAGTCIVAANQPGDMDYAPASEVTQSIVIAPASPTLSLSCTEVTYDGAPHSCVGTATGVGGVPVDGNWTYEPATVTSAGSTPVTATFTSLDTDYAGGTASSTLTINPASSTLTLTCTEVTYDGAPHSCVGSATGVGGAAVTGTWSYEPASVTAAGSTAVTATFTSSNANYNGGSASSTLTINPATPTLSLTCTEVTYDGTPHACVASATGVGGAAVSGTWSYEPTSVTAAGSTPVTATFTSSNTNYSSGTATSTLKINPATPTLTLTCTEVTYDGEPHSCVGSATGLGGAPVSGTWNYEPATVTAAGSTPVTATFTSTDTNYASGTAGATLTINTAAPTLTLTCTEVTYDGAPHSCTGSATGIGGAAVSGTWSYEPASRTAAGSSPVTATFTSTNTNYTGGTASGTLTINPATPAFALTCTEVTYDGASHSCTGSATGVGGGAVSGTWSYEPASRTAAGSSPVTGTFTSTDANYVSGAASGTLKINPANPTLSLTCTEVTYDGAPHSCVGSATGIGGAAVSGSWGYSPASVTTAGTTPVTGTFTSSDSNYADGTANGTLTINKATATVSLSNLRQTYTGQPRSVTVTTAPLGLSVNVTYDSSTAAPSSAGTYSVAASVEDDNYTGEATATFTIDKAAQNISFAQPQSPIVYTATPISLSATGGASGNPVVFSVVSGPATVSGSSLTLSGLGTVVIAANQSGNSNYESAPEVTRNVVVTSLSLTLGANALNFGSVSSGATSPAQTVIVGNPNALAIPLASVEVTGDFNAVSNCPAVPALGTCSINVTFAPATTGTRTGTLTIRDGVGSASQVVSLTGIGVAPGIQIAPATLDFGSQPISTRSIAQTINIVNTGTADLAISNIATTGDFAATGNCASVMAGTACTLSVTFTPSATGARTGTITLTTNAGTRAINLSGTGTAAGARINPGMLNFAGTLVGASSFPLTAQLTNTGTAPLTGISVSIAGDFSQTNTCEATLAAGEACSVSVSHTPTIAGEESGSLIVATSLGPQTVPLKGVGLVPGALLSPAQLVFGGQLMNTKSAAQTVVFTNTGTGAVTINAVTATEHFDYTTNCTGAIAPAASCSVNVFFNPAAVGPISGALTVTDTAGEQVVTLQGRGVSPGLTVTPSTVTFGGQIVGTTSLAQTLVATNTGSVPLTLNPIAVSSNFVESDNCPATLQPGTSCSISLSFAPTASGSLSGSMVISDSSNLVATPVAVSGQGTLPGIAVSPSTLAFGSLPVGTTSQAQTVTVTNTGTAPLRIGNVTGTADFAEMDTCSNQSIAPGANCVISVTMTPTTVGTRTGSIRIENDVDGGHLVATSGVGQQAGATIVPTTLAFGSAPVTSSFTGTPMPVLIYNTGNVPLQLQDISTLGDFTQSNNCGGTVAVGATCTLNVTFAPTALGHRTGTLTIANNAGTQVVSLQGDGNPVGLNLTPPVLNFGTQPLGVPSPTQSATLTNNTGHPITGLTIVASGEFNVTSNCGATLANGASCTLQVSVTPLIPGAVTGRITILADSIAAADGGTSILSRRASAAVDAASSSNVGVVALTAAATPLEIAVDPSILSFPQTLLGDSSPNQTITLRNTQSESSLSGLTITQLNQEEFPSTSDCGATLAAEESCTITVGFNPNGLGARSGNIVISADGGLTATVPQSGSAVSPVGQFAFAVPLPGTMAAGGNLGSSVSVQERDSGGTPLTWPTDTIVITVTGPAGYSRTYTATAVAGVASFDLSADALTVAGTYTCTVSSTSNPSVTPLTVSVVVQAAAPATVTAAAGSSQSATVKAAFATSLQVLVRDAYGNAVNGATVTFAGPASGAGASFSPASVATNNEGTASVVATANETAGQYTVTASAASATPASFALTNLDFALNIASGNASQTVNAGGSAVYTVQVSPQGSETFPGEIALALTGLPAGATYTVSPASIPAGSAGATVTITVTTAGAPATAELNAPENGIGPQQPISLAVFIPLFGLCALRRQWRKRTKAALMFMVLLAIAMLAACGGGGSGFYTRQPKTYSMTLTGTSGQVQHAVTLNLTVQ